MEISSGNNQQSLMATLPLEEILISCQKSSQPPHQQPDSKKPRPNPEQALKCPRCDSTNTKFCYYNNYSLSQPRYFCKGCKRYWTKGGSLRNVPVGGGSRKNKKLSSNLNSSFLNKPLLENNPVFISDQPSYHRDLNLQLAFARLHGSGLMVGNPNPNPNYGYIDALYQNGFMHGFYGFGPQESQYHGQNFENGEVSSGIGDESANTTTIQGSPCKSFHGAERKDLVGLNQWQLGGDGLSIGMDFGRENFNAFASSNYHGLINKSLI